MLLLLHLQTSQVSFLFEVRKPFLPPIENFLRKILFIHLDLFPKHSCPSLCTIRVFIWKLQKCHQSFSLLCWTNTILPTLLQEKYLPVPHKVLKLLKWNLAGIFECQPAILREVVQVLRGNASVVSKVTSNSPGGHPPGCCWRDCTPALSWAKLLNEMFLNSEKTLSWGRGQIWWHSPSLCCSCQKSPELNESQMCTTAVFGYILCLSSFIRTCVSTSATATSLPEGVSTKKISSHIRMPVVSLSMPPLSAFYWWPMPSWENQNQSCLQQDGSRLVTGKHHFVYNCTLNRQWQSLYPSDNRQEADLKI